MTPHLPALNYSQEHGMVGSTYDAYSAGFAKGREHHEEMLEMLKRSHVYLGDKERIALINKIETNG